MLEKFDFLVGEWNLEHRVPRSSLSDSDSGIGTGVFRGVSEDRVILRMEHPRSDNEYELVLEVVFNRKSAG